MELLVDVERGIIITIAAVPSMGIFLVSGERIGADGVHVALDGQVDSIQRKILVIYLQHQKSSTSRAAIIISLCPKICESKSPSAPKKNPPQTPRHPKVKICRKVSMYTVLLLTFFGRQAA